MSNFLTLSGVLVVIVASACGGGSAAMPPTRASAPMTAVLSGQVTDRVTSAPIPGARVIVAHAPTMLPATTDSLGRYSVTGLPDPSGYGLVWAAQENYEDDLQYHRSAVHDFRLYPIQRITPGASAVVTVAPDDTLCWNNTHEPGYGSDFVCRIVRVAIPTDGILTVEALSTLGGSRASLVVQLMQAGRLLEERLGNPTSLKAFAGSEAAVFVEVAARETTTQSFRVMTAFTPR